MALAYLLSATLPGLALAVMTAERVPELRDVPTLRESGLPGIDVSTSAGVLVLRGTPPEIVQKLNQALSKVAQDTAVQNSLAGIGSVAVSLSEAAFAAMIDDEAKVAQRLHATGKLTTQ